MTIKAPCDGGKCVEYVPPLDWKFSDSTLLACNYKCQSCGVRYREHPKPEISTEKKGGDEVCQPNLATKSANVIQTHDGLHTTDPAHNAVASNPVQKFEPNAREATFIPIDLDELKETLCLTMQLLHGWHADGTCWGEHDSKVEQRIAKFQNYIHEAANRNLKPSFSERMKWLQSELQNVELSKQISTLTSELVQLRNEKRMRPTKGDLLKERDEAVARAAQSEALVRELCDGLQLSYDKIVNWFSAEVDDPALIKIRKLIGLAFSQPCTALAELLQPVKEALKTANQCIRAQDKSARTEVIAALAQIERLTK